MARNPKLKQSLVALAAVLTVAGSAGSARAVEVRLSDDVWFDFHYLLQSWVQFTNNAPAQTSDLQTDFLVKRSRLGIKGQVAPGVGFFLGTGGDANFGSFDVWDAVAWVEIDRAFVIDAGLVMLPFVHHAQQFSRDLHTLDFLKTAFRYPTGSTVVRRDGGVRFRGLLFDDLIDYRVSVTDGVPNTPDDIPRFTGRVAVNLFDPEPGYVPAGTYLGKKRVLSLGVAFDLQPDVVVGEKLYYALAGDVFWDLPFGPNRLSGTAAVLYYRGLNGKDATGAAIVTDKTGIGAIFDIGYAIRSIEPLVAVEWFRPEGADDFEDQQLGLHVGLNWWVYGLAVNLKLDLALQKEPGQDFGDAARVVTLQLQTRLP